MTEPTGRTVLYARVSTVEQTIAHQESQARAAGFTLDAVVADHGVSGVSTRLFDRPEGRRLPDLLRAGDVLVVRWLDRLGRNYADVTQVVRGFLDRGITVKTIINAMTFEGGVGDPMSRAVRDAMIGFMAAMGEAQAEAAREAQRAGILRARTHGAGRGYLGGKPSYDRARFDDVVAMLEAAARISAILAATGLKRQTIYRIRDDRPSAEATHDAWEGRGASAQ